MRKKKNYEKAYICFRKANTLDVSFKIAQNKIDELLKIKPELSKINETEI